MGYGIALCLQNCATSPVSRAKVDVFTEFCSAGCLCRIVFQGPSCLVPHQRLAFGDAFSGKLLGVNLPVSICCLNVNKESADTSEPRGFRGPGASVKVHGTR
jgi:hypothetical protein